MLFEDMMHSVFDSNQYIQYNQYNQFIYVGSISTLLPNCYSALAIAI